jgi:hypothetical protein
MTCVSDGTGQLLHPADVEAANGGKPNRLEGGADLHFQVSGSSYLAM